MSYVVIPYDEWDAANGRKLAEKVAKKAQSAIDRVKQTTGKSWVSFSEVDDGEGIGLEWDINFTPADQAGATEVFTEHDGYRTGEVEYPDLSRSALEFAVEVVEDRFWGAVHGTDLAQWISPDLGYHDDSRYLRLELNDNDEVDIMFGANF